MHACALPTQPAYHPTTHACMHAHFSLWRRAVECVHRMHACALESTMMHALYVLRPLSVYAHMARLWRQNQNHCIVLVCSMCRMSCRSWPLQGLFWPPSTSLRTTRQGSPSPSSTASRCTRQRCWPARSCAPTSSAPTTAGCAAARAGMSAARVRPHKQRSLLPQPKPSSTAN